MTIDRDFEIAVDIFSENEIFNVQRDGLEDDLSLSAALKMKAGRPLANAQVSVLSEMFDIVRAHFTAYEIWVLVSNGGEVPDNRIVRHFGLWRGLEKGGVNLPPGERTNEFVVKGGEGVQFFGAIRLASPDFLEIVGMIKQHSSTHIVMSDKNEAVLNAVAHGWHYGSRKFPTAMLSYVSQYSMFLLAPVGDFDDIDGGAVALSTPPMIKECFAS